MLSAAVRVSGCSTPLIVATSHLESPCGKECEPVRIAQLATAQELLEEAAQEVAGALQVSGFAGAGRPHFARNDAGGQQQEQQGPAVDIVYAGDM